MICPMCNKEWHWGTPEVPCVDYAPIDFECYVCLPGPKDAPRWFYTGEEVALEENSHRIDGDFI